MSNTAEKIDRNLLKKLNPLSQLSTPVLDELADKSVIDTMPSGRIVCRSGDKDSRLIFLLSGQIEQTVPGQPESKIIKAKSPLATPVAEGLVKPSTLKTKTTSTLLYVDADLLELLTSDSNSAQYEVTEISNDESDDWMLTFLQSPAFLQLPTENIQQLLVRMEELSVKKGQTIITQGGNDEYYYIVKTGSCSVSRKPYPDAADVLLAVLPAGSGFGEESLITNGKRNATITMRENGTLMRLGKKDFMELLSLPLINYISGDEAKQHVGNGSIIIDVRSQEQIKKQPIGGTVNIPLSMLRLKFDSLNAAREYLLICNDGALSSAAAFLMIQNGFKCSVLKGGISTTSFNNEQTTATAPKNIEAQLQEAAAKKHAAELAAQAQQAELARKKAEQEIIKNKKELEESRTRLASESQKARAEAKRLKEEAEKELRLAKEEAKAAQEQQSKIDAAMRKAAEIHKASEEARKKAEQEAEAIRQRAIEEAEYLKAEVEAARKKMEEDAIRIKKEEQIIKQSALKVKKDADKIRQEAILDAQQIRNEIESTRALLDQKLQQTEQEEAEKRRIILEQAKLRAEEIAKSKTSKAEKEAEAIRRQAKQEAERLHSELEQTRDKIKQEANRAIRALKEQSEVKQPAELLAEDVDNGHITDASIGTNNNSVNLSSVKIPGSVDVEDTINTNKEKIDDASAQRKAESIKARLEQSQKIRIDTTAQEDENSEVGIAISESKIHKLDNKTILESDNDLFIFKEPSEKDMEFIDVSNDEDEELEQENVKKSEEAASLANNPFLNNNQNKSAAAAANGQRVGVHPDVNLKMIRTTTHKTNYVAIAASMLLIIAGAIFTLHATNTLKVQAIAAIFNSGNETTTAVAKKSSNKKNISQAKKGTGLNKTEDKFNEIVDGWNNFLTETKNPKKNTKK